MNPNRSPHSRSRCTCRPQRSGRERARILLPVLGVLLVCLLPLLLAQAPSWWAQPAVVNSAPASDFAAANQGQLKTFALAAYEEFHAKIPAVLGGVGPVVPPPNLTTPEGPANRASPGWRLRHLLGQWVQIDAATGAVLKDGTEKPLPALRPPGAPPPTDFAAINLGQLKAVTAPFYDRLAEIYALYHSGQPVPLGAEWSKPWTDANSDDDNYAMANLGQLKRAFQFHPTASWDTDADSLRDSWEQVKFGSLDQGGSGDYDKDGFSNLQEFLNNTDPRDPIDFYRDKDTALLKVSGDGQTVLSGQPSRAPLVVRLIAAEARPGATRQPVANAPVAVSGFLWESSGLVQFRPWGSTEPLTSNLIVLTDENGYAQVEATADGASLAQVTFSTDQDDTNSYGENQASFDVWLAREAATEPATLLKAEWALQTPQGLPRVVANLTWNAPDPSASRIEIWRDEPYQNGHDLRLGRAVSGDRDWVDAQPFVGGYFLGEKVGYHIRVFDDADLEIGRSNVVWMSISGSFSTEWEFVPDSTNTARPDENRPDSGDSDADGIPDDDEIAAGLNYQDFSDAVLDLDGDGVPNLWEYSRPRYGWPAIGNSTLTPPADIVVDSFSPETPTSYQTLSGAMDAARNIAYDSNDPRTHLLIAVKPGIDGAYDAAEDWLRYLRPLAIVAAKPTGTNPRVAIELVGTATGEPAFEFGSNFVLSGFRVTRASGAPGTLLHSWNDEFGISGVTNCIFTGSAPPPPPSYDAGGAVQQFSGRMALVHNTWIGNRVPPPDDYPVAGADLRVESGFGSTGLSTQTTLLGNIFASDLGSTGVNVASDGYLVQSDNLCIDLSLPAAGHAAAHVTPGGFATRLTPAIPASANSASPPPPPVPVPPYSLAPADIHAETRPLNPTYGADQFVDADDDGMPDWFETLHQVSVATADKDGDELSNLDEYLLGTSASESDSDGDGLSDGDEVDTYHSDPRSKDTDGDGLYDGAEVNTHHSDPTKVDTDGDGLSDFAEVTTHGTDPSKIDTDDDNFTDPDELLAGSNPNDSASFPLPKPVNVASVQTGSGEVTTNWNLPFPITDEQLAASSFRVECHEVYWDSETGTFKSTYQLVTYEAPAGEFILTTDEPGRHFSWRFFRGSSWREEGQSYFPLILQCSVTLVQEPRQSIPAWGNAFQFALSGELNLDRDTDRDGASDILEIRLGADPINPQSRPNQHLPVGAPRPFTVEVTEDPPGTFVFRNPQGGNGGPYAFHVSVPPTRGTLYSGWPWKAAGPTPEFGTTLQFYRNPGQNAGTTDQFSFIVCDGGTFRSQPPKKFQLEDIPGPEPDPNPNPDPPSPNAKRPPVMGMRAFAPGKRLDYPSLELGTSGPLQGSGTHVFCRFNSDNDDNDSPPPPGYPPPRDNDDNTIDPKDDDLVMIDLYLDKGDSVGAGAFPIPTLIIPQGYRVFAKDGTVLASSEAGVTEAIPAIAGNHSRLYVEALPNATAGKFEFHYTGETTNPNSPPDAHPLESSVDLLPVDIAVDADRNGLVEFGKDTTTPQKPFRFWINDDYDLDYNENDEGLTGTANKSDTTINGIRDLEDLTQVKFKIPQVLVDMAKAGTAQLGFKWKNVTQGSPSVRIWSGSPNIDKPDYLKSRNAAIQTLNQNDPLACDSDRLVSGTTSVWLRPNLMNDATSDTVNLLMEGVSVGVGTLTFMIKVGTRVSEGPGIDLKLLYVRQMFERGKITPDAQNIPNPWDNPNPQPLTCVPDPWNWQPDIDPDADKTTIVYVHGWRMTYNEYLQWADTTFKRLWQLGYKGRFYAVRWPTLSSENDGLPDIMDPALYLGRPGGLTFNPSEYRAWLSGPALATFVNNLPNAGNRYLISHSLGAAVCGSALRSGMGVTRYAMCNAAVAAMAYDGSLQPDDPTFETPDTDGHDGTRQTFGLKNQLNLAQTEIVNFSLPDDAALGIWSLNNRFLKPQGLVAPWNTRYVYRPLNPPGQKLFYDGVLTQRPVTRFAEAMAHVTQSRTRAAGAREDTGGSVVSFVHLGDDAGGFGFGHEHSAEWLYTIQKTYPFWKEVLKKFDVDTTNQ